MFHVKPPRAWLAGEGGQTLYWPNRQSPRMMWYHDHTSGLTRLNVYAGMAAPFLLRDGMPVVPKVGIEPTTFCLQSSCSPN